MAPLYFHFIRISYIVQRFPLKYFGFTYHSPDYIKELLKSENTDFSIAAGYLNSFSIDHHQATIYNLLF